MSAQAEYRAATLALIGRTDAAVGQALAELGNSPSFSDIVDVSLPVTEVYGDTAAVLAADFYDAARVEAVARGVYAAEPAPAPGADRVRAVAGWGLRAGADPAGQLTLIRGGLVRAVIGAGRDTVRTAVARDPAAHGWRRVSSAGACDFCRMLAGRGEVYRKDTARFASHDHCSCLASPAFAPGLAVTVAQYAATQRTKTEADRARVRAFLADMPA